MDSNKDRQIIHISGIVQGVGFRPFVYKMAQILCLKGWIKNSTNGVIIEIEGNKKDLNLFISALKNESPPLSHIEEIVIENAIFKGYESFEIIKSDIGNSHTVYISPDVSICNDCLREIDAHSHRRFKYPFTNCTNCGPRFTITKDIPYDRINTVMESFEMCNRCKEEYTNPEDRRFHAQPISCPDCGPKLSLLDGSGFVVCDDIISTTRDLIKRGKIIAIKGIGGYHLCCDAKNTNAVNLLRARKRRDGKPFAVMAKNLKIVSKYCRVCKSEADLLLSIKRPILLLEKLENNNLPEELSKDNNMLGVMLPYTPLHSLLFEDDLELLVMTSGNISGEPIFFRDDEAKSGLREIADYFLVHDREIYIRTDDSVTSVLDDKEFILRRSRGYVPLPTKMPTEQFIQRNKSNMDFFPSILACGAELKNTFCLTKKSSAFLSHHIGDIEGVETLRSFEEGISHFRGILKVEPEIIAFDLHPDYISSKYAKESNIIQKVGIQHHHAHISACMAENGIAEKVIGVAFDGTGYGEDGNLWGAEFFTGDYLGFKREAYFKYVLVPGGEASIKEPWRMALSLLKSCFGNDIYNITSSLFQNIEESSIDIVIQQIDRKINSPLSSSAGRLFDAVSGILGLCTRASYEGQAAVILERYASINILESYPISFKSVANDEMLEIDIISIFGNIVEDMKNKVSNDIISSKFHNTLAEIILRVSSEIRMKTGINKVVLSGGVFQNRFLIRKTIEVLKANKFNVYTHCLVPTNDGGISLGQASIVMMKAIYDKQR